MNTIPFPLWLRNSLERLRALAERHEHDEDPRPEQPEHRETVPGLCRIGAWVGRASMTSERTAMRHIDFAKRHGLGRLDVVVNDHSKWRQPSKFDTYPRKPIEMFCRIARAEGFKVHLMSWWMPHEDYIATGSDVLTELAGECEAVSVMLDCEEPWTQALGAFDYEQAAQETVHRITEDSGGWASIGVTGIGYAPANKLGPLCRLADYVVPQVYTTSRNNLDPVTAAPHLWKRWRTRLCTDRQSVVIGLAAYRQTGRAGYTREHFMNTAFTAARSCNPTDIVYWSLRHIRSSPATARTIRKLSKQASFRAEDT